jgi:hypothetical protein
MYRYLRSTIFLILIATIAAISYAQASFSLIRPSKVPEGRRFSLTFRLSNGEANAPKAPQLEGCRLLYGPSVSTMQSTEIINGKMKSSSSVDYSFIYMAEKAGQVKVPALSVNVDGKTLTSNPATFTILPADKSSASSAQQGGQQQQQRQVHADDVSTQTPGKISANDLIVRVSFSKTHVYEQEAVIATIKVYTKYNISSFLVTTQPAFEGFLSEELPVQLETQLENYNGQNYYTAVLKRLLLYPQKSGTLSVNSGKYDVTIVQYETVDMGYFRTNRPVERKVTTSSNAATIQVSPLPTPQPAGFSGAVGQYSVSTELNPELLKTNEAATYSYIIKGTGNIKYLKEPNIEFPADVDKYTPNTDIDAKFTGSNMSGTFRVDYTIVPQEVGKIEIPATPFIYFNPQTKEYVTLDTKAYEVNVARGASTSTITEQKAIDKSIDDIRYIKPVTAKPSKELKYVFYSAFYWLAYVLAIAILIGIIIAYRRQIRLNADIKGRKLARAGRVATRRLKAAHSLMNAHKNEEFYAELSRALWGYVSDKLGIAPSQLMRDNIAERLTAIGASEDTVKEVIDVLDECEMARFTPEHSEEEIAALYDKTGAVIKNLENVTKK